MKFVFFSVILFKTVFAGMPLKPDREIMMTLRERERDARARNKSKL
jgi:hypothetical protein